MTRTRVEGDRWTVIGAGTPDATVLVRSPRKSRRRRRAAPPPSPCAIPTGARDEPVLHGSAA
jgi:hypothetical protein